MILHEIADDALCLADIERPKSARDLCFLCIAKALQKAGASGGLSFAVLAALPAINSASIAVVAQIGGLRAALQVLLMIWLCGIFLSYIADFANIEVVQERALVCHPHDLKRLHRGGIPTTLTFYPTKRSRSVLICGLMSQTYLRYTSVIYNIVPIGRPGQKHIP